MKKKRTTQQIIGEKGEDLVKYLVSQNSDWISRGQERDYGLDIEAELTQYGNVTGCFLKFQVRTSQSLKKSNGVVSKNIEKSLINYAFYCRVPVILVLVDLNMQVAYYVWLQEWMEVHRIDESSLSKSPNSVKIVISQKADLVLGLKKELKEIASCESHTQLFLDIRFSIKTAIANGNYSVGDKLTDIFVELTNKYPLSIARVIDEVLALGLGIWATFEGNKASQMLYNICRNYGHSFTTDQIEKIVCRELGISRTGINALGILYDEHPEHILSLQLATRFSNYPDPAARYYCLLREKYPGVSTLNILREKDCRVENYNLAIDKAEIFNKWANRGDSVILDYFCEDTVR